MKDSVRYREVEGHPQAPLIKVFDGLIGIKETSIKQLLWRNRYLLDSALAQVLGNAEIPRWTIDESRAIVNEMLASVYRQLQEETKESLEKGVSAGAAEAMAAATAIGFVTVRLPFDLSEPFLSFLADRKPKVGDRQQDAGAWIFYSKQGTANGFRENYQIRCVTTFTERFVSCAERYMRENLGE